MNKKVRFKSVIAASLLKFEELDNVDISLLLEDLEKEGYYVSYRYYLEDVSKYAMIREDGRITLRPEISLESIISENGSRIKDELKKVVDSDTLKYFNQLDVEQFRKRKEIFLKSQREKILKNGHVLLITDSEEEYEEMIKYGFSHIDYFKSIVRADRYFEKYPDEALKYHIMIVGNQSVIHSVFIGDRFLEIMKKRQDLLTIDLSSWHDSNQTLTAYIHLHDLINNRNWNLEEHEYSKVFDRIVECASINKITSLGYQGEFTPIKEEINPNRLPLPEKKKELKILYLDAISVGKNASEISRDLGLDVTFREDNNSALDQLLYSLGDYDIVIASSTYSSQLVSMNVESTEQCKDTGRNLVLLLTYQDRNYFTAPIGYQIELRYSYGGSLGKQLDSDRKTYKVVDRPEIEENRYQREKSICMKSILESAVELYQNALEKQQRKIKDFDFQTIKEQDLEYEQALAKKKEQEELEKKPILDFNHLYDSLTSYLEYKRQGLVPRKIEGIQIEEDQDMISAINIYNGIPYCMIHIPKKNASSDFKRFMIQIRSKKGRMSDKEEVAIYTKRYEGKDKIPKRLNEEQQNAFTSICKKVNVVVNPILADIQIKLQERGYNADRKPKQKNFRRRNDRRYNKKDTNY